MIDAAGPDSAVRNGPGREASAMKHRLRLSGTAGRNEDADRGDHVPASGPAPLPFHDAAGRSENLFPSRRSDELVDDVLRSLDQLSITLDDLRREIDLLDEDHRPDPAA